MVQTRDHNGLIHSDSIHTYTQHGGAGSRRKGIHILKHRLLTLCLLLTLVLASVGMAYAQDPTDFPDRDGDGVLDDYDACPDQAGNYYGCPDGVNPPDGDADGQPDVADNCPTVFGEPYYSGCPDSDGDGVDDFYDNCPTTPGFTQNNGCTLDVPPDWDRDGVINANDYCPYEAGPAESDGCPDIYLGDTDGDGVIDYKDVCRDEAGDPNNSGCPAGVTPDFDYDGVGDAVDLCPRESGSPANNGCLADRDGDLIDDANDGCPDQQGDGANFGCPAGVAAPDSDGDGMIDIYDRCPSEAGVNGLDCPDRDGDGVADLDDQCPDTLGEPALAGCERISQVTLPGNRAVIGTSNAAALSEVGSLRMPVRMVQVSRNGWMAVQSYGTDPMAIFDLNLPTVTAINVLESQGGNMAMSANGQVIVDTLYDNVTFEPALTIWDVPNSMGLHYLPLGTSEASYISDLSVAPDGSRFVTTNGVQYFGPTLESYSVRVWDVASGTVAYEINDTAIMVQVAYSPDGQRLAIGTLDDIRIVDANNGTVLMTLAGGTNGFGSFDTMTFNADGTRLASAVGNGVRVYDLTTGSELYAAEVMSATPWDTVNSLAFSPDGSLLVASVGPFVDGPQPAGMNLAVVLLDAATGARVGALEFLPAFPSSVTFNADGTLLIFADYGGVHFYGVAQ